jgi:hypothetical protein
MTKADIQFKINQLRNDKIIYAVESIATTLAMLVGILITTLLSQTIAIHWWWLTTIQYLLLLIALLYWVYMGVGNFYRLREVKRLEKLLEN